MILFVKPTVLRGLLLGLLLSPTALDAQARESTAELVFRTTGEFTEFSSMAVDRSGQLLAAQPSDHAVLLFTPDGTPLGRYGRRGGGPGEFGIIGQLGLWSDGFWVDDPMQRRFTMLSSALAFTRTQVLQQGPLGVSARFEAMTPDGALILSVGDRIEGRPYEGKTFYRAADSDKSLKIVARSSSSLQCQVTSESSSGSAMLKVPYCLTHFADVSPDGSMIVILSFDHPQETQYRVTAIRSTGDTLFSRRYDFRQIPIARSVADSITTALVNATRDIPHLAELAQRIRLPATFPPITGVVTGIDGTTWLAHHTLGSERSWTILDLTGRAVARVSLRSHFRVLAVSRTQAWGTERDGDDVPQVVSYRLRAN